MISHRFAEALHALGKDVTALRYVLPEDASDVELLRKLQADGSVLVTVDQRIRSRPHEREALHATTAFFIAPFFLKQKFWAQAVWLIRYWPRLEEVAMAMAGGTCIFVQQNGKMQLLPPV